MFFKSELLLFLYIHSMRATMRKVIFVIADFASFSFVSFSSSFLPRIPADSESFESDEKLFNENESQNAKIDFNICLFFLSNFSLSRHISAMRFWQSQIFPRRIKWCTAKDKHKRRKRAYMRWSPANFELGKMLAHSFVHFIYYLQQQKKSSAKV